MRSNNKALLLAGLLLGGCSNSWWRDPPAAGTAPVADAGVSEPAGAAYPDPAPPPAEPQRYEPPVPRELPRGRATAQPDYDAPPPPARAVRYDNVGYAAWSREAGTVAGAHPTLPPGSFVEVTALDTGKTVLVPITASSAPGREIELSGAAAQELGLVDGGSGAVRVRAANPTGGDLTAFRAGRPAPARPDTPPVLLNALRRKLQGTLGQAGGVRPPDDFVPDAPVARPPVRQAPPRGYVPSVPARTTPTAARAPVARAGPGYYVQVAAMADAARAAAVAREVGGAVSSAGGFHRVRFGPFEDLRTAQAARDDVARRGYADARIVRQD